MQKAIASYPECLTSDIYDHPAVLDAWREVVSEVTVPLGFMTQGPVPPAVWEAKAEVEQLGRDLGAQAETSLLVRPGALDAARGALERMARFFERLDPAVRSHPIVARAIARNRHGFMGSSRRGVPKLSPQERADLKRRRLYEWTHDAGLILIMAELVPPSQEAEWSWGDDVLGTKRLVTDLVESAGARPVQLYMLVEEDRLALLLTYGANSESAAEDVTIRLAASGQFTVRNVTRVLPLEDFWYANLDPLPFADIWKEEDMDDEEREAFHAYRRRWRTSH